MSIEGIYKVTGPANFTLEGRAFPSGNVSVGDLVEVSSYNTYIDSAGDVYVKILGSDEEWIHIRFSSLTKVDEREAKVAELEQKLAALHKEAEQVAQELGEARKIPVTREDGIYIIESGHKGLLIKSRCGSRFSDEYGAWVDIEDNSLLFEYAIKFIPNSDLVNL